MARTAKPVTPPDLATLAKAKVFRTLTGAEEQTYGAQFQSILLGA